MKNNLIYFKKGVRLARANLRLLAISLGLILLVKLIFVLGNADVGISYLILLPISVVSVFVMFGYDFARYAFLNQAELGKRATSQEIRAKTWETTKRLILPIFAFLGLMAVGGVAVGVLVAIGGVGVRELLMSTGRYWGVFFAFVAGIFWFVPTFFVVEKRKMREAIPLALRFFFAHVDFGVLLLGINFLIAGLAYLLASVSFALDANGFLPVMLTACLMFGVDSSVVCYYQDKKSHENIA